MSSLARRGLTTAAAAVGIAAIGTGVAVPAFAAPQQPTAPKLGDAPAAPDTGALKNVLGKGVPSAPDNLGDLPMLFNFEGPSFYTADPELPLPGADSEESQSEAGDLDAEKIRNMPSFGSAAELAGTLTKQVSPGKLPTENNQIR